MGAGNWRFGGEKWRRGEGAMPGINTMSSEAGTQQLLAGWCARGDK